ncbi:glycosyltransferase family 76 protein [Cylindrobasidium torrendii FP15055 ss-10]|uniref:GPI mannosyltransferase 2 n=1 Tax=Cylindrobasidium torrendii FP15055 ss-10 TaxID=1314674 RepID=A0A0D7BT27_9AGAR|nr:glycosyltransferase family 76 protein [Cylindrobasidium torrendii FP15055 ss-10]
MHSLSNYRLVALTLCARLGVLLLATVCAAYLEPFDSSGGHDAWIRWDAIHFAHVAKDGYTFEHDWAFLSGLHFLLRHIPRPLFYIMCTLMDVATTLTLHDLTLEVLGVARLADLATALSLLPSSPATFRLAPYNEPFFAFLAYSGMLYCQRKQFLPAAIFFTLAGFFRSNNILLGGFIMWSMLVVPFFCGTPLQFSAPFFVLPIFLPFIGHNAIAYMRFCSSGQDLPPAWCSNTIPSIYTYVQGAYWNVGFLNYFSPEQIPNFLISAPVIALIYAFGTAHIRRTAGPPFERHQVTPHVLHSVVFTTTLVFSAHTQIILRVASSMPVIYWAAAWLLVYHPTWGKAWVLWSVIWGCISIVLWATFLPPA